MYPQYTHKLRSPKRARKFQINEWSRHTRFELMFEQSKTPPISEHRRRKLRENQYFIFFLFPGSARALNVSLSPSCLGLGTFIYFYLGVNQTKWPWLPKFALFKLTMVKIHPGSFCPFTKRAKQNIWKFGKY